MESLRKFNQWLRLWHIYISYAIGFPISLFLLWIGNKTSVFDGNFGGAVAFVLVWVFAFSVYRLATLKFQPKQDALVMAILALVEEMKQDRKERNGPDND